MSNNLAHNLELSLAAAERCAQRAIEFLDEGEEQTKAFDKLYSITEGYCMLEERAAISAASVQEAKSMLREKETDSFDNAYNSQVDLRVRDIRDMKSHPKYLKFDKSVKALFAQANDDGEGEDSGLDDGDDELRVTEAEVNTIDPISQQVMVSPVKNKICGHAYEKSTILEMLKTKKRMRCPYVGCPNRGPFSANDLEDHEQLKRILKRHRAK